MSDADKAVAIAEIEMSYRVELFNMCALHRLGTPTASFHNALPVLCAGTLHTARLDDHNLM
jgi:hypothetical protein